MAVNDAVAYGKETLPAGVRSRFIPRVNGLTVHILEAGFEEPGRPCVLLLHGFPELAYSWRKQLLPLAEAGFHVIAPDQRGYGRTTGWDGRFDGDVGSFRMANLVKDALALVFALGYRSVAAVVGHDFGSPVAAYCGLMRPDVFRAVVLMSAPFGGPPSLPFGTAAGGDVKPPPAEQADIHTALAALPRARKHYQRYYSTREADKNMHGAPQGIHDFLRGYYHYKSADWPGNRPFPLAGWRAAELAKMPTYYIMDAALGMAETVAPEMPSPAQIAACGWLTDAELAVYSGEFRRNGFQGGLQWYRCGQDPRFGAELQLFSHRTVNVPSCFIAGARDWGVYQRPGNFERMQGSACTRMRAAHLLEGAGHWVQQEQPQAVSELVVDFLRESG